MSADEGRFEVGRVTVETDGHEPPRISVACTVWYTRGAFRLVRTRRVTDMAIYHQMLHVRAMAEQATEEAFSATVLGLRRRHAHFLAPFDPPADVLEDLQREAGNLAVAELIRQS